MKALIVTALFPPDVSEPAKYTKRLASHLSGDVTVLHFGSVPEFVKNVSFVSVPKTRGRIRRFVSMTQGLFALAPKHDVLIIQNGPSVEIAALLVSIGKSIPSLLIISDEPAHRRTRKNFITKLIHAALRSRCTVIEHSELPQPRPVIHPFKSYPASEIHTYEQAWDQHTQQINSLITTNV